MQIQYTVYRTTDAMSARTKSRTFTTFTLSDLRHERCQFAYCKTAVLLTSDCICPATLSYVLPDAPGCGILDTSSYQVVAHWRECQQPRTCSINQQFQVVFTLCHDIMVHRGKNHEEVKRNHLSYFFQTLFYTYFIKSFI